MAVAIEGGEVARRFRDLLASFNDPLVYNLGELGVGMNPAASWTAPCCPTNPSTVRSSWRWAPAPYRRHRRAAAHMTHHRHRRHAGAGWPRGAARHRAAPGRGGGPMSIDLSHDGDGVATVLMNRPQKRNAFTLDMYREFGRVMRELEADDAVRCVESCAAGAPSRQTSAASPMSATARRRRPNTPRSRVHDRRAQESASSLGGLHRRRLRGGRAGAGGHVRHPRRRRGSRYGIPVNRIGLTVDHQELVELMDLISGARPGNPAGRSYSAPRRPCPRAC